MKYQVLFDEFTKIYKTYDTSKPRGIGIEMELPIVTKDGRAVDFLIIQKMFDFLKQNGFQLYKDNFSNHIISASRVNKESSENFDYHIDAIMTDAGNSILEIVLAPQDNLHAVQSYLSKITNLLVTYFDTKNCKILGYGIQPKTSPSRELLMPKERYLFFEKFSPNNIIPKVEGADAHLLTITASNQCHIGIHQKEAISAVNVLNALSGLQIILHANSSIWNGGVDSIYKANREVFWDYCYPDRLNQMGIPPYFENMEAYIQYLLDFEPMLVKRTQLLQILNKPTVRDFFLDETPPAIGQTLEGKKFIVKPRVKDIHYLNSFCYFNARLAPRFGTIESRMCCQQPPNAALAPTAVTLGLLANLESAKNIMKMYPWKTWKNLRIEALKHTFNASINGNNTLPLIAKFLDTAKEGLIKRNLGEEVFLEPLYERLTCRKSPADKAIDIFKNGGIDALVKAYSFTKNPNSTTQIALPKVQTQNN